MNSRIILAKNINVDREYTNVLSYSETQMLALLRSQDHLVAEANNYSFLRTNGNIMCGFTYDQCLQSNYIAFQNPYYSNKWFFAWIDDVIFKGSNKLIELTFTIDAWSTWFDNWTAQPCFVSRHHVNNDTIGINTVPENLDVGTLISDHAKYDDIVGDIQYYWCIIATNYNPGDVDDLNTPGVAYGGIGCHGGYIQGCQWFGFKLRYDNLGQSQENTLLYIAKFIRKVCKYKQDGIEAMFAVPFGLFDEDNDFDTDHRIKTGYNGIYSNSIKILEKSQWFRSFTDYSNIKNNKLLCYPYSFLRVSNNSGNYNDYHIEDFGEFVEDTDGIYFGFQVLACIGVSGAISPISYRGLTIDLDNSVPLGKFPTFSWATDAYTNWLTQNGVNMQISNAFNTAGAIGSIVEGRPITGTLSMAKGVADIFGAMRSASFMANTAEGNANTGDRNFIENNLRFKFMRMRPKKEYLQKIDNYFSRFRLSD